MSDPQNDPKQTQIKQAPRCTAQRKHGAGPCKGWAVHGSTKCRMHGGTNQGAKVGNQNALKSGLFAACFSSEDGRAVYEQAVAAESQDNARHTVGLILAKVHESFVIPGKLSPAADIVRAALLEAVQAELITDKDAADVVRALGAPKSEALARALAPLKGLLDATKTDQQDNAGTLREAISQAEQAHAASQAHGFDD